MSRSPYPIAVLCSDLHLSLKRPVCRNDESWLEVQARYLGQLKETAAKYGAPVVCAGDIFDRWNSPPELITFALRHLPDYMYCVPGQHDLPTHRYDEMTRSAYGTLVEAGKIYDLPAGIPHTVSEDLTLVGIPWGFDIAAKEELPSTRVNLAVIHRYCWKTGRSYPGAPKETNVAAYKAALKPFTAAVFGDNHKGFLGKAGNCTVLNSGGFIRRKSDEVEYEPSIGILFSDGSIKRRRLDTSQDKFLIDDWVKTEEAAFDMKEFLEGLESLGEGGLDFVAAMKMSLEADPAPSEVMKAIWKAIENE